MVVVVMVALSGVGTAAGCGGGSCGFEKDGLVPVGRAASTAATVAVTSLFDCFHFAYFNTQICQPIAIIAVARGRCATCCTAAPATIDQLPTHTIISQIIIMSDYRAITSNV